MPLFSLFSGKKDASQLEQARREFISQVQALRQDIQVVQQGLIEEMRQLSSSVNASHAKQIEQVQVLAEGIRRSSKSIETLRESTDKLHSSVSYTRLLADTITQLQEKVESIPSQISQLLPPIPPTVVYNGKLDEYRANRIDATKLARTVAEQQMAATQTWENELRTVQDEHDKEYKEFYGVLKRMLSPVVEQETGPMPVLGPEKEDNSQETA